MGCGVSAVVLGLWCWGCGVGAVVLGLWAVESMLSLLCSESACTQVLYEKHVDVALNSIAADASINPNCDR